VKAKKDIRIFFSWQSDLPKETTTNAIRASLILAANEVESKKVDLKIVLEEATSNMPGSPDIPATIFEKISLTDIFIADITTINSTSLDKRKTANPNVLIELGFALSQLGSERVLLLFNDFHGNFPDDVSFDIDRKRIGKFRVTGKGDKGGKGELTKMLETAIALILEHNPKRPSEKKELSTDQKKRAHDIINLKWILSKVSIYMLERHIESSPDYIDTRSLYFYEDFKAVLESSQFYLYDKTAFKLLQSMLEHWSGTLLSDTYRETSDPFIQKFGHSRGISLSEKDKSDFKVMLKSRDNLDAALKELVVYIRETYLEINVNELSQKAYTDWLDYTK
jgi:hypothetical protein